MFRFSLGRIPVEVHPSHLFVSGLIAATYRLEKPESTVEAARWPYSALLDPSASQLSTQVAFIAIWMGIVFISVLVHELGHAVVSRAFGYRPSIHLVWLGGQTNPNAGETIPWHRDVLLTLAGPLFGLAFGVLSLVAASILGPEREVAYYVLDLAWKANLFWALLNLVPIVPLDGGRILNAILVRGFGRKGFITGQLIALLIAVAGIAFGAKIGAIGLVLLFGFVGMTAFALLTRAMRGEAVEAPPHPYDVAFEEAKKLYRDGKLDRARKQAEQLLVVQPQPSENVLSRARHILGWIALKDGDGRAALEHFSKVTKVPVEAHALAAAFSLAGDDPRALEMWQVAWKQTGDRTVLHEYAGTVLRVRGEAEARSLPGVDLGLAYTCAVRVLTLRGELVRAGQLAEQATAAMKHFQLAYDGACAFARAGEVDAALRLLERAGEHGFADWDYAASDSDLERLHRDARFPALLSRLRESRAG